MELSRFYEQTRDCRKILVPDLGFLGDTLHLFPALREIREAYPSASLHVIAADHVKDLLRLVPWIDQGWGYPRFPTSPPWYRLIPLLEKLRRERFDLVINLNGSSRSSFLTAWTGAKHRLGRMPERKGNPLWTRLYTHRVTVPYDSTPVYEQRRQCLKLAGLPVHPDPQWAVSIPEKISQETDALLEGARDFIHVSPFTTLDAKEMAPAALAECLNGLARQSGDAGIVITCAPNARETSKLSQLLPVLEFKPRHVFPGTLSTLHACAVIGRARLHVGGDSGGVHMAVMQKVPVAVWFREHSPLSGWAPRGKNDLLVFGKPGPDGYLQIDPKEMTAAALSRL